MPALSIFMMRGAETAVSQHMPAPNNLIACAQLCLMHSVILQQEDEYDRHQQTGRQGQQSCDRPDLPCTMWPIQTGQLAGQLNNFVCVMYQYWHQPSLTVGCIGWLIMHLQHQILKCCTSLSKIVLSSAIMLLHELLLLTDVQVLCAMQHHGAILIHEDNIAGHIDILHKSNE